MILWKDPKNVLVGCPHHGEEFNLLLSTDASVEGWGAHLEEMTVSGVWLVSETSLHENILELKAVFLVIKAFQIYLQNKRVPVASDNAIVLSYLNKQGWTLFLEVCLIVWCLMSFCNFRAILLRAYHIQGCLNVIAYSISRRDKFIQIGYFIQIFSHDLPNLAQANGRQQN